MGWITPVITWIAGNGIGFSDLNRIEGDLKYLREENKTINGTNTFSGNITQTAGVTSLKATTINAGTVNTVLTLESTDQDCALVMRDATTVNGGALRRRGEALSLLPSGGKVIVGSGADNTVDLLQVGVGLSVSMGVAKWRMGYIADSNQSYFGEASNFTTTNYLARQHVSGGVRLNAASGQDVDIYNGGVTKLATFSGSAIQLLKPVTITGNLTANGRAQFNQSSFGSAASAFVSTAGADGNYGVLITASTGAVDFNLKLEDSTNGEIATFQKDLITFKKTLYLDSQVQPTTTPTSGTWTSADDGLSIPRGQYTIAITTGGSGNISQSGTLVHSLSSSSQGWSLYSDGTNTVINISGSTVVNYWKF